MNARHNTLLFPHLTALEELATGRGSSIFVQDIDNNNTLLTERLQDSRIAIIGAAGSIGLAVLKNLLPFAPKSVVLFDLDENGLVEVVRELRSSADIRIPEDFVTLPIGLGSIECIRYFQDTRPFDYILNLSAMKHVRSEKDVYSLMRMIDTNVLFLEDFLSAIPYTCRNVFSVSSDKAVNPANLMGASKMIMEKILLSRSEKQPFSTARIANVAFSHGSLPFGFLMRLQKRQALAAPHDVKRFFLSHQEAGQLCLLSFALADNREVYFPKPSNLVEKIFSEIAIAIVEKIGYEPHICSSEEEARSRTAELISHKKWPCYFTTSNTTGEKPFEEFYTQQDLVDKNMIDMNQYQHLGVLKQSAHSVERQAIAQFLTFARQAKHEKNITKSAYVQEMQKLLPSLHHVEMDQSLDEKM